MKIHRCCICDPVCVCIRNNFFFFYKKGVLKEEENEKNMYIYTPFVFFFFLELMINAAAAPLSSAVYGISSGESNVKGYSVVFTTKKKKGRLIR